MITYFKKRIKKYAAKGKIRCQISNNIFSLSNQFIVKAIKQAFLLNAFQLTENNDRADKSTNFVEK